MSLKFNKTSYQSVLCLLPTAFNNIAGSDLSISLWAYVIDFAYYSQWTRLLDAKYDANNYVQFSIPYANRIQFDIHETGTDRPIVADSGMNVNQWYHLCGVWFNATNTVQFYIDTVAQTTVGDTSSVSPGTAGFLNFGRRSDADPSNTFYSGLLDDVRIYNRALPLDEVQTIHACRGTDGIVYGLQNRWLFDEKHLGAIAE